MAIRWTNTSLSVVDWNRQPRRTRARFSASALVRLPLCDTAKPAELELGIQRLHVAQHRLPGGGIPVMPDRRAAGQRGDDPGVAEIVGHQAQPAVLDGSDGRRNSRCRSLPARDAAVRAGPARSAPRRRERSKRRRCRIPRAACRRRSVPAASANPPMDGAAAEPPRRAPWGLAWSSAADPVGRPAGRNGECRAILVRQSVAPPMPRPDRWRGGCALPTPGWANGPPVRSRRR